MIDKINYKIFYYIFFLILSYNLFGQQNSALNHFTPVWTNNPYLPMNIYISGAVLDGISLTAGDEIGVFDGNICVGSKILTDSITQSNPVSVITSTDDQLTPVKDGFTQGNKIYFRIWDSENQKEVFNCFPDYQIGNGTFVSLGSSLLSLRCYSKLGITPLRFLIEAMFDGQKIVPDTAIVELRKSQSPYQLLDSCVVFTDTSGSCIAEFNSVNLADSFYIVVKHRNSIEIWSKLPQQFTDAIMQYDFTIDSTTAYGNNLVNRFGKWCIYSGDVNQDGAIDSVDLMMVYNDNVSGLTGYINTDVNYDEFTEVQDLISIYINFLKQIYIKKPNLVD
uniref:Dockerin domain-containing protein n=1 Tax=Ignavibacterium album TaxID=591197 RepID=A0A7V2ZI65_9BACT